MEIRRPRIFPLLGGEEMFGDDGDEGHEICRGSRYERDQDGIVLVKVAARCPTLRGEASQDRSFVALGV